MKLIDAEKAWQTAQIVFADPIILHAVKTVLGWAQIDGIVYGNHERLIDVDSAMNAFLSESNGHESDKMFSCHDVDRILSELVCDTGK